MRVVLFLLGAFLILQVTFEVANTAINGSLSFASIGAVLDANLVKLTAAMTALVVAKRIKRL